MSASEVQICNLALMKFGNLSISTLEDATKEARFCKVFYPLMRDELVYSHPWNFALRRADISAQLATTPAFEWSYAYTLPADCLRVWELYGTEDEWVVESGELLTNKEEEIYIRYIRQVTETGRFSPSFVNCLATRLGAEGAARLADDNKMRISLLEELYKIQIPAARIMNAMEGKRPARIDEQSIDNGNFSWQTEGR